MSLNNILRELGFKPHPSNWLHFAVGSLFGVGAFIFCYYQMEFNILYSVLLGTSFATFAGLAKEFWDMPKFDWLDLIMTALGGFAGAMLTVVITFVL